MYICFCGLWPSSHLFATAVNIIVVNEELWSTNQGVMIHKLQFTFRIYLYPSAICRSAICKIKINPCITLKEKQKFTAKARTFVER